MDLNHGVTAAEGTTRRRMLGRAGALAAAGGVTSLAGPGAAGAAVTRSLGHRSFGHRSLRHFLNFTVTQEKFGVTAVTNAINKAPGTPSEQFLPVLRSVGHDGVHARRGARGDRRETVDLEVLDSGRGLRRRRRAVHELRGGGGHRNQPLSRRRQHLQPAVRRIWRAPVRGGAGTEAEHRVLSRFAASQLGAPTAPPNNVGFEPFPYKTTDEVVQALTGWGIGYGRPGAAPGAFYDYPGDPVANGVGDPVDSPTPT
jgi:hypothetical protein